jgi:hypothetical protein
MKTINTFLPVFNGYYGTLLGDKLEDLDGEIEYFTEQTGREITYEDLNIDYKKASKELSIDIFNEVSGKLIELGVIKKAKFEELNSPREYNFYNDSIYCEMILTKKNVAKIKQYLTENNEAFKQYLKDRYTPCSGFIPYHPNYINCYEWTIDGIISDEHRLGAVLNFICQVEEYNEESIYYDVDFFIGNYIELKEPVEN